MIVLKKRQKYTRMMFLSRDTVILLIKFLQKENDFRALFDMDVFVVFIQQELIKSGSLSMVCTSLLFMEAG